jgi:hypothetical protein
LSSAVSSNPEESRERWRESNTLIARSITCDPLPYERIAQALVENPPVKYFKSRHRGSVAVNLTRNRMETRMNTRNFAQ